MSKRSGRKSQGANDFLMPYAPTIDSASNVGTARPYNDGAVDISFTADPRNAATSYTVLSSPGSYTASGASSPIRVTGLASDTAYTFTVTATNTYGTSAASAASGSVTATTVPATPGAPSATAQGAAANDDVSWSAPATGGSAITSYTWSSSDGKGNTQAGTSVTVAQEAGTAQTYNVYATNANGNSGTSSNSGSVTSFSFTPFSFAPFTPFGFTPFGAFGFSPPSCVHEDTLIDTPNGKVKAKDVQVGNEIVSVSFSEIPNVGANGESDFDYVGFSSPTLTVQEKTLTTVVDIVQSTKNSIMFFNQDQSALFSTTQPFFIKRNNNYEIIPSGAIEVGDSLISIDQDGQLLETEILNIDYLTEDATVYQFGCEPQDWFVAGNYLVHNK